MRYDRLVDGNVAFKEEPVGTAGESKAIEIKFRKIYEDYMKPVSRLFADATAKFLMLKADWETQTAYLSSINEISMYPAYQEIIGMGEEAVPLILAELKKKPGHWFWALKAITGADPVMAEQRGRIGEMADAWLRWGVEHGYSV